MESLCNQHLGINQCSLKSAFPTKFEKKRKKTDLNPQQPKVFGMKFTSREIERIFPNE